MKVAGYPFEFDLVLVELFIFGVMAFFFANLMSKGQFFSEIQDLLT
jgi:hypothetical protein